MTSAGFADHNQYLFEQGNKLYQQEQFQEAIKNYESILHNGYESWALYYNLGNAYFRLGKLGKAILNFERAYRLNPDNEDVLFNLNLAKMRAVDNIPVPPLAEWMQKVKYALSMSVIIWLLLGFYFLTAILIAIRILLRQRLWQRLTKILLVPAVIILLLSGSLFYLRAHEETSVKYAILLVEKTDALGSPEEDGTVLFSLHEGVKFKVESYNDGWARIRLANGSVGWVKKDVFEII
ncbi:MAG: tetratricopeptide repeat protein [Calditrichaeota bacterium]|nr:tetratricopeptide repeat protein [Calditrichota bacterium]